MTDWERSSVVARALIARVFVVVVVVVVAGTVAVVACTDSAAVVLVAQQCDSVDSAVACSVEDCCNSCVVAVPVEGSAVVAARSSETSPHYQPSVPRQVTR